VRPLPAALLASLFMASAVAALVLGLRPRRRTIAEVRSRLQPSTGPGVGVVDGHRRTVISTSSAGGSSSHWRSRPLVDRARRATSPLTSPLASLAERRFGAGLRLAGRSADDVATRVVLGGLALGFVTLCLLGSSMAIGTLPGNAWWSVMVLVTVAAGAFVMWSDTSSLVARRRREFRRTVTDFVQLVAVGLTTDQSVEEAVQFALGVGDSDLFELLHDELATAPLRGVPLWEALDQLGRTFDQRELCEFAGSIERQGTQGVSITDTVNSLATAMRAKALDELERDADRANANLSGPTIGFVVATMVFLAFPLAVRIGEAFGG
jgi:Flp pilus assembly protein TadB